MSEEESYVHLVRGSCEELGHKDYSRAVNFLSWTSVPYRVVNGTERFDCIIVKGIKDKMPWIYPLEYILDEKIFFELTGKFVEHHPLQQE